MKRMMALVSTVLLLATSLAWGQDPATAAEKLREETSRRGARWKDGFLEAFLGSNRAESQPRLSECLEGILKGRTEQSLQKALSGTRIDAETMETVLKLALDEAKRWELGDLPRRQTVTRLWSLMYRGPPPASRAFRNEGYGIPESLDGWLLEEQKVNWMATRTRGDRKLGNCFINGSDIPAGLNPLERPVFWLPYLEIPVSEALIMEAKAGTGSTANSQIFFRRGGRQYLRYFIHPGSLESPSIQRLIEKYPVKVEYLASMTASPRSLAIWNPYTNAPPILVKVSLSMEIGRIRRVNKIEKGIRAVMATNVFDSWEDYGIKSKANFLREPLAMYPEEAEFGNIVREMREGVPSGRGRHWVPGQSLMSARPDGKAPLLVQMIRRSRRDPMRFVTERIVRPYIETFGEVALDQGMVGEPHQQNVMFEVGRDGLLTGRIMIRDLDSHNMDLELRLRQKHSVKDLFPWPGPGLPGMLKLTKGRSYYGYTYDVYVRDLFTHLSALDTHFRGFDKNELGRKFNEIMGEVVKERLGVEPRLTAYDMYEGFNQAVAEFRDRRALEQSEKRADRVSQDVLRQEFKRLLFNYRTNWVGSHLPLNSAGVTFLLHPGVIELQVNGKARAFALLEPRGSGSSFYSEIPWPRKAPNPRRLAMLYDHMPREGQDLRESTGAQQVREILRKEAATTGRFAAAFVLKEGVESLGEMAIGAANADPNRVLRAVREVTTPAFVGDMMVFTAGSRAMEAVTNPVNTNRLTAVMNGGRVPTAVATAGTFVRTLIPGGLRAAIRGGVGMAAGMTLVDVAHGRPVNGGEVALGAASYTAGGVIVDILTGRVLPAFGAKLPATKFVEIAKLAASLYAGDRIQDGAHALTGSRNTTGALIPAGAK